MCKSFPQIVIVASKTLVPTIGSQNVHQSKGEGVEREDQVGVKHGVVALEREVGHDELHHEDGEGLSEELP